MKITIALILSFITFTAFANELQGKVIKITDGDTINILTKDNEVYKIRLSGIDAPEKKQAFGNKSKQALADAVDGQIVSVEYNKLDKYQRVVGKILLNGKDINLRQIQLGLAWHYKKYEREQDVEDRAIYADAEYLAQRDKLGIWTEKDPTPPWEFRKQQKAQ